MEQDFINAIRDGIREGVKMKMSGYNSPLDKQISAVLAEHDGEFRQLVHDAISSAISDTVFRDEIKQSMRHKLATLLVSRFGGELEKQVNALKSDPATRARITLAIEEIVKR